MNPRARKVVVAMSGGVDSSVAAALLVEQGYSVTGVTMIVPFERLGGGSRRTVEDAAAVAKHLGIAHEAVDVRRRFDSRIVRDFCRGYAAGRTPNPCVLCNRLVKFDLLRKRTEALGAGYMATGHYARIDFDPLRNRHRLRKGRSRAKDQSYFLYQLGQRELARTLLPVGGLTKPEVRKSARAFGLPVAFKEESQEVCFVPDDDYPRFLASRVPEAFVPGPILDRSGRVLGTHLGIGRYTIGQRRGLGIAAPRPLYVLSIDAASDTLLVGPEGELSGLRLRATNVRWISGIPPRRPVVLKARIRYRHRESPALISPEGSGRAVIEFRRPQRAITPGQSVVFYRDDEVIGGGTIDAVLEAWDRPLRPRN